MMQRPSDELLVAYMDGEVDEAQFAEIAAWLERDPGLRARLANLTEVTTLIRDAFEPVLREPIPERLFAATHDKTEAAAPEAAEPERKIVAFRPKTSRRTPMTATHWWVGLAAAVGIAFVVGAASVNYLAPAAKPVTVATSSPNQLDNLAGYHDMFETLMPSAEAKGVPADLEFPADAKSTLPSDVILPDLRPWGLIFQGGRRIMSEGKPAFQFVYSSDNNELGKVSLFVTTSPEPDVEPTYDKRHGVNLLYWRHLGHGYYIVGGANQGWMWSLKNDIAYQLKAM
jgi:anti-sigma factor RsiW